MNISFIVNITIKEQDEDDNGNVLMPVPVSHPADFQLIGIMNQDKKEDFAKSVIKKYDLTCVQFAIENPEDPCSVRSLNDEVMKLFLRSQFMMYMDRYRDTGTLYNRVAKYMDRGYMFVGFILDGGLYLKFNDCCLVNEQENRSHNGDARFVENMMGHLQSNVNIITCLSSLHIHEHSNLDLCVSTKLQSKEQEATHKEVEDSVCKKMVKSEAVEVRLRPKFHSKHQQKLKQRMVAKMALMKVIGCNAKSFCNENGLPKSVHYLFKFNKHDSCTETLHNTVEGDEKQFVVKRECNRFKNAG